MSQPMTFSELAKLLDYCYAKHSVTVAIGEPGIRAVKYVDPHVDMRDGKVFAVRFRGFGWEEYIHTQNECRDLPHTLYERCIAFLTCTDLTPAAGSIGENDAVVAARKEEGKSND